MLPDIELRGLKILFAVSKCILCLCVIKLEANKSLLLPGGWHFIQWIENLVLSSLSSSSDMETSWTDDCLSISSACLCCFKMQGFQISEMKAEMEWAECLYVLGLAQTGQF